MELGVWVAAVVLVVVVVKPSVQESQLNAFILGSSLSFHL